MGKWLNRISGKELKLFSIFSVVLFLAAAVIVAFSACVW